MSDIQLAARELRMLRAANDVLKNYRFETNDAGEVEVTGGSKPYTVTVRPDWSERPHCTCPDHKRTSHGGFCKHVIAVLLRDDAIR